MAIRGTYFSEKKLYSISVGKTFDYTHHNAFKDIYESMPGEAEHIELDMQRTNYIDSSALGMMLMLNEFVHERVSRIDVVNSRPSVKQIFDISHFNEIFNIAIN